MATKGLEGIVRKISKGLATCIFSTISLFPTYSNFLHADTGFIDQEKIKVEEKAFEESIETLVLYVNTSEGDKEKSIINIITEDEQKNIEIEGHIGACQFSANGDFLAVKGEDFFIFNLKDNEVRKVDLGRGGLEDFKWSNNSKEIYLVKQERTTGDFVGALYCYDIINKDLTQLTTPSRYTRKIFPSRTDRDYVIIAGDKTVGSEKKPCLFLVEPSSKSARPIGKTDNLFLDRVCCSLDDKIIYQYVDYYKEEDGRIKVNVTSSFYFYDINTEVGGYLADGPFTKDILYEIQISQKGDLAYTYSEGLRFLKRPYKDSELLIPRTSEISPEELKWSKNGRHLFFRSDENLFVIDVETKSLRKVAEMGHDSSYDIYPK